MTWLLTNIQFCANVAELLLRRLCATKQSSVSLRVSSPASRLTGKAQQQSRFDEILDFKALRNLPRHRQQKKTKKTKHHNLHKSSLKRVPGTGLQVSQVLVPAPSQSCFFVGKPINLSGLCNSTPAHFYSFCSYLRGRFVLTSLTWHS